MIPVIFPQAYSKPLGAGDNPNTGDLPRAIGLATGELPVCVGLDPKIAHRICAVVSCWEPSEEELAEMMRTKKIYIGVMASQAWPTQPPIWVLGYNPFEHGIFKRVHEEDVKHLGDTPETIL